MLVFVGIGLGVGWWENVELESVLTSSESGGLLGWTRGGCGWMWVLGFEVIFFRFSC